MIQEFKAAKAVSVPIVAISTQDQLGVIASLSELDEAEAVIRWDLVRGASPLNDLAAQAMTDANFPTDATELQMKTQRPSQFLSLASKLKNASILMMNAHKVIDDPATLQAVCNIRDAFGKQGSCVVLFAPDWTRIPPEIGADAYVIDDPLPDEAEIKPIIVKVQGDAGADPLDDEQLTKAAFSLAGLSRFSCVQAGALMYALNNVEFNNRTLQEFKEQRIKEQPGLDVYKGTETFKDVGGSKNAIDFVRNYMQGPEPANCIVFIDEIEKYISDDNNDTSGVNQDAKGTLLSEMENMGWDGMIAIGPPGSGKSLWAKAVGNEYGIPTIMLDLGGVKGSLVGQSEQQLRSAFKVIRAIGRGRVLAIATCNKITTLPPEVVRRFHLATFYFELPTATERPNIWAIHKGKYGITNNHTFDDTNWTGAEIAATCRKAYKLNITLDEAAKTVVPYFRSNRDKLNALRDQAHQTYISASYEGTFDKDHTDANNRENNVRAMKLARGE